MERMIDIFKTLPVLFDDLNSDWINVPNNHDFHCKIMEHLQPVFYVELGARLGHSIIAALHGAQSIKEVFWVDAEQMIADSNKYAAENIDKYLKDTNRKVKYKYATDMSYLLKLDNKDDIDFIYIDMNNTFFLSIMLANSLSPKYILLDDYINIGKDLIKDIEKFCKIKQIGYYSINNHFRGQAIINLSQTITPEFQSFLDDPMFEIEYHPCSDK
jgi:hypothetical protein